MWNSVKQISFYSTAVPKEHQWGEGSILGTELLAVVSGGASSTALQELSSAAVTSWLVTQPHPSPGLLLPLVASASRTILHLNHRNPILHAGLSALFSKGGQLVAIYHIDFWDIMPILKCVFIEKIFMERNLWKEKEKKSNFVID